MEGLAAELSGRPEIRNVFHISDGFEGEWLLSTLHSGPEGLTDLLPREHLYLTHYVTFLAQPENWLFLWDLAETFPSPRDQSAGRLSYIADLALSELTPFPVALTDKVRHDGLIGGAPGSLEARSIRLCLARANCRDTWPSGEACARFASEVASKVASIAPDWRAEIHSFGETGARANRMLRRRLHKANPTSGDPKWPFSGPTIIDIMVETAERLKTTEEEFGPWSHAAVRAAEDVINKDGGALQTSATFERSRSSIF
jgi:hypothetical protein